MGHKSATITIPPAVGPEGTAVHMFINVTSFSMKPETRSLGLLQTSDAAAQPSPSRWGRKEGSSPVDTLLQSPPPALHPR